ncbi:hypothetical protein FHP25_32715 [Vineibacter terrae]|uniref:Uncharacterized protein n=1 Tax=Vineibacter terrae TaxID=2586908 RepID=A0A5C8PAR7_9HYPH|nr:hypothetical protein [Vineibacter terrae]TXL70882.1 hypothetical protein FHP25_32715 [Vineibacter terrae]
MPLKVRLPQMPLYAGFAAGALGLLGIIESYTGVVSVPLLYTLRGAWLGAIGGAVALGVVFRRHQPGLLWPTIAISAIGIVFFWVFDGTGASATPATDPIAFVNRLYLPALFLVLSLVLFIFTFRIGLAAYALFALCVGLMLAINFDSAAIGIGAFATFGALMAVINYIVQLVLDHRHDFCRALRDWRQNRTLPGTGQPSLWRLVWIWGFAFLLTLTGALFNYRIQSELTEAAYKIEYKDGVTVIRKDYRIAVQDRDLEHDMRFSIQAYRADNREAFEIDLERVRWATKANIETFPQTLTDSFAKLRPPVLDSGRPCNGFKFKLGSVRTPCRNLVNSGNGAVQGEFNKRQEVFNKFVAKTAVKTESERQQRLEEARALGLKLIDEFFDDLQRTADAAFLATHILSGLSYLMLAGALVAAAQMVLGRAIYREQEPQIAPSREQTFRLPGGGPSQNLSLVHSPVMYLTDQSDPEYPEAKVADKDIQDWYVSLRIARRGEGTQMCLSMPDPHRCFLQRLLTARLIVTRIAMQSALHTNDPPQISVPGDHNLVRIRIKKGQQVCFRMRDLAAFTTGVTFRSIYTTYIGAHFLGLGTFYGVAEGEGGHLVLQSDGEQVQLSAKGDSTPAVNLLAWDRAHEFSLAQKLSVSGVWFNDPSLKLRSASGCAVLDESCAPRFPLASRIWRLFRYLVLPV